MKPPVHELEMRDIISPDHGVDVSWSEDNKKLFVNVDGVCVLRISDIPDLTLNINNLPAFSLSENPSQGVRS